MPKIIRSDYLMVPDDIALERKKKEIKKAIDRAREFKKARKREEKLNKLRKRKNIK